MSEDRVDYRKAALDKAELELKIARNALPALVARLGGEVIITDEELEELDRAYAKDCCRSDGSQRRPFRLFDRGPPYRVQRAAGHASLRKSSESSIAY